MGFWGNRGKQIAVGRPGVGTGEHGLETLEDFVVQADPNWGQVYAAGLPRRRLMDGWTLWMVPSLMRTPSKSRINSTPPR